MKRICNPPTLEITITQQDWNRQLARMTPRVIEALAEGVISDPPRPPALPRINGYCTSCLLVDAVMQQHDRLMILTSNALRPENPNSGDGFCSTVGYYPGEAGMKIVEVFDQAVCGQLVKVPEFPVTLTLTKVKLTRKGYPKNKCQP